jgi:tetratricopeptide (TPR) repeat protein
MEKALDLDEDNVDFLQYIAKLYHISDNSEKAIIFYKKALALLPDSTDTWLDLAELYYADFENFNLAIATLNEANVAIGHVDNEIITRISAYLFLNGQIDEAELFLLSIQDTDFDYIGKILLYDSTLINNQPFWEMAERLKN